MIEQWFIDNASYLALGVFGIIAFWQFRKWNVEKYKERNKQKTKEQKEAASMPDQDVEKYIAHPEETIAMLKLQRNVFEKSKDLQGVENIDKQIQMLQFLTQIPAPARPYVGKIGQALMKKVSGMVDNF